MTERNRQKNIFGNIWLLTIALNLGLYFYPGVQGTDLKQPLVPFIMSLVATLLLSFRAEKSNANIFRNTSIAMLLTQLATLTFLYFSIHKSSPATFIFLPTFIFDAWLLYIFKISLANQEKINQL